jgi:hypothetical protein
LAEKKTGVPHFSRFEAVKKLSSIARERGGAEGRVAETGIGV